MEFGPRWAVVYRVRYVRPILGVETIEIHGATWVGGNRSHNARAEL